jgi:hypothetical protein
MEDVDSMATVGGVSECGSVVAGVKEEEDEEDDDPIEEEDEEEEEEDEELDAGGEVTLKSAVYQNCNKCRNTL